MDLQFIKITVEVYFHGARVASHFRSAVILRNPVIQPLRFREGGSKTLCGWFTSVGIYKQKEEMQLREHGISEEAILKLRESDWADFNEECRHREHQAPFPNHEQFPHKELESAPNDIQSLVDSIEDEPLLHTMLRSDRETLRILLLRVIGYSVPEISEKLKIPDQTIYTRIRRLRKKLKKFQKSE